MFGYVRPALPELTMRGFNRFRAAYCGMCHELSRSFGIPARFILNYDFVFLYMLLYEGAEPPEYRMKRCAASPFCSKCVCMRSGALTRASGLSVILAYRKLCDDVEDERGLTRFGAKCARLALSRAYKKAAAMFPEFDAAVSKGLSELAGLEASGERSLDRAADAFAALMSGVSEDRVKAQMLYHIGRIIYIADAYRDLEEDIKAGRYNPVAARFSLTGPERGGEAEERVRLTLQTSAGVLMADSELLEESYWREIIRNIVFLGVPEMIDSVMAGTYTASPGGMPREGKIRWIGDTE